MTNAQIQQAGNVTNTKHIKEYYEYVRRKEATFIKMLGYSTIELACNINYAQFISIHFKHVLKVTGRPTKTCLNKK